MLSTNSLTFRCSASYSETIKSIAINTGSDLVALTSAEPFSDINQIIEDRKLAGLAGSMQFTYRNPSRSTDVTQTLHGAQSLIVCAVSYAHVAGSKPTNPHSKVAQYATSDSRNVLKNSLVQIKVFLEDSGWKARIFSDDNGLVDRAAAMRAGIGFFGKNSLMISKQWGSTILLGTVATNAPLQIDSHKVLEESIDGCGTCTACIPACPTNAILEGGIIDATKCLSWIAQSPDEIISEHRIAMGNRIYGCDECQNACPFNKIQQRRTSQQEFLPQYLDLKYLLTCSDQELLDTAGDWYVYKRDPRFLRRNALINAGNSLDQQSEIWDEVRRWSQCDDQMLCEYARWALDRRKEKP